MSRAITISCLLASMSCWGSTLLMSLASPQGTIETLRYLLLVPTVVVGTVTFLLSWRDAAAIRNTIYKIIWPVAVLSTIVIVGVCVQSTRNVIANRLISDVAPKEINELSRTVASLPAQPDWRELWDLERSIWMAESECLRIAARVDEAGFKKESDLQVLDALFAARLPQETYERSHQRSHQRSIERSIGWQRVPDRQAEQIRKRLRISLDALANAAKATRLSHLTGHVQKLMVAALPSN